MIVRDGTADWRNAFSASTKPTGKDSTKNCFVGSSAARTDVSMIKFFGAKVLHDVVDRALQLHGGLGYSTDMPLEMLYRYARHARFVDGADEVHRESVARHILRAYEAPDDGTPTEHVPTRRTAAREKFADVLAASSVEG